MFPQQEVFPEQYGRHYDTAVQTLTWEFLSRLEQLFPVPDLKQVLSIMAYIASGNLAFLILDVA